MLAGALVLGGAAGVGGAAAYDAFNGDGSSTSASGPDITASNRNASASNTGGSAEAVAEKVLPSVVQINVTGSNESGSGSGIVLSKDGLILTNNHVASVAGNSGQMRVDFDGGTSAPAKLVGADPVTDLAVIKASGVDDAVPAEIGKSSGLKVGENVVAIGSPYGLGATVTSGIVSALNRAVSVQSSEGDDSGGQSQQQEDPFGLGQLQQQSQSQDQTTTYPAIQTDAAINPGNSGGPLVNLQGQVVGINSSIRTSGSGSSGSIGLGFAIPMDEVLPIVNQLKDGETATHAQLGVSVRDNQSSSRPGALVATTTNGGSAAEAGIEKGDVITKVDDVEVSGSDSLVATIRGHRPGDEVKIQLYRDGKEQTVTAKLGSDEGGSDS
ncbi:peptidase S1 [Marmoricola endophyticus]|uniref:Peptidase S1 n=1 Tax=Marmoricola endophyticus TaxID=2040280 RepID=A0A917BHQ9_9ACTN|nr:peptidase S1 [Marmoricola endophyticus]